MAAAAERTRSRARRSSLDWTVSDTSRINALVPELTLRLRKDLRKGQTKGRKGQQQEKKLKGFSADSCCDTAVRRQATPRLWPTEQQQPPNVNTLPLPTNGGFTQDAENHSSSPISSNAEWTPTAALKPSFETDEKAIRYAATAVEDARDDDVMPGASYMETPHVTKWTPDCESALAAGGETHLGQDS